MAGLTEFYCRLNETNHASQFKWLDNTFKRLQFRVLANKRKIFGLENSGKGTQPILMTFAYVLLVI
jgi:hypothetical protein